MVACLNFRKALRALRVRKTSVRFFATTSSFLDLRASNWRNVCFLKNTRERPTAKLVGLEWLSSELELAVVDSVGPPVGPAKFDKLKLPATESKTWVIRCLFTFSGFAWRRWKFKFKLVVRLLP